MTRVVWTEPAIADLHAIRGFIGRDSELYGAATIEKILASVDQLERFPRSGRAVPEASSTAVREIIVARYRVIHRVKSDRVEIIAVIHAARDLRGGRIPRRPRR